MNNPIRTTEYLQTETGEKFYPKTIDSQVEISIDGKNGTVKDELISINNKFGGYTTTAELPKTYTPTEELEKNYLKISDAANTYSTINQLNNVDQKFNNYTETTILENTYATIEELNNTNNKFNSYTLTENLQVDYLSKNDAADTYLPISALDETVANSVGDYVNSEEMKTLLFTKNEFNQYANEVSSSFGDVNSNIISIENDISGLKTEDININNNILDIEYNSSIKEVYHYYNPMTKIHKLDLYPPSGAPKERDWDKYKHFFFYAFDNYNPGDIIQIGAIDKSYKTLIPLNALGENIADDEIFKASTIVHFSVYEDKCFFKSGGTSDLNYKVIGGSTYPKSNSTNLIYNDYNDNYTGIVKTDDGGLEFTVNKIQDTLIQIGYIVSVEPNEFYTINLPFDDDTSKSFYSTVSIKAGLENGKNLLVENASNSKYITFKWDSNETIGKIIYTFSFGAFEKTKILKFYPQLNKGRELLSYEPYRVKENTLLIDNTRDSEALAKKNSLIETEQLNCFISETGVMTAPSTNTYYTKIFPYDKSISYNIKLDNGQTTRIAAYSEKPKKGSTGTVFYGNGKEEGAENLDYIILASSPTIPEDTAYLAIYYYDSSKNKTNVNVEVYDYHKRLDLLLQLASPYDINETVFYDITPWDIDFAEPLNTIKEKYINSDGGISSGTDSNKPCYAEEYIPVSYGTNYDVSYDLISEYFDKSEYDLWFCVCEYKGNEEKYTFVKRGNDLATIKGTQTSFVYTPSATNITAVRLTWRTFGYETKVTFIEQGAIYNTSVDGNTWIKTGRTETSRPIKALKKNPIILDIDKAYIYSDFEKKWIEKEIKIFKDGKWI